LESRYILNKPFFFDPSDYLIQITTFKRVDQQTKPIVNLVLRD